VQPRGKFPPHVPAQLLVGFGFDLGEVQSDARLDRPFAPQSRAKRMDRADETSLAMFKRLGQPGCFEFRVKPLLQFRRGFAGKGDRHHRFDAALFVSQQRDHPRHQLRGLAGARGGLDEQIVVEFSRDPVALGLVGRFVHGFFGRSSRNGASVLLPG
jgi:hypothetical protein